MAEALRAHNSTFQVARMDDWRLHLNHIARAFRDFGARPDEITFNALAANIRGGFLTDETQRQWQAIAEDMAAPLHEAQAEGRIRQDIDPNMVITMLFTSITGLIVIAKNVPTDDYLHRLVSLLIAGCEVRP